MVTCAFKDRSLGLQKQQFKEENNIRDDVDGFYVSTEEKNQRKKVYLALFCFLRGNNN